MTWTSPMWALPNRNMDRRDWPMPPPMVRGSLPSSSILWKGSSRRLSQPAGGQLPVQGGGVHPDAHGGELQGPAQHVVPQQNVAVEGPVVVVGGPAVVGLAATSGRRRCRMRKVVGCSFTQASSRSLGVRSGKRVLQLLGGDEGHRLVHLGQDAQLGEDASAGSFWVSAHGADNGRAPCASGSPGSGPRGAMTFSQSHWST